MKGSRALPRTCPHDKYGIPNACTPLPLRGNHSLGDEGNADLEISITVARRRMTGPANLPALSSGSRASRRFPFLAHAGSLPGISPAVTSFQIGDHQFHDSTGAQGTWPNLPGSAGKCSIAPQSELGTRVIETASVHYDGRSDTLVGEAIQGIRDQVFLVSKLLPCNASADGTLRACEMSLKRLDVESLDRSIGGRFALSETL
jgi:hypothetical protein